MNTPHILINSKPIGPGHPAYVIAEIGFNHGGDLTLAERMIESAANAGADAAKFQSYRADQLVLQSNPHFDVIKGGELSLDDHRRLAAKAKSVGIDFISTPYDQECVGWLEEVGASAIKVASMDVTNLALLKRVAANDLPVLLSTGMAIEMEIKEAINVLESAGCENFILMHCISKYPAELNDAHVSTVRLLAERFGKVVGYSDHTLGIAASATAVALGASVIEKHFTTDKTLEGPDHAISADQNEMAIMIESIRDTEKVTGVASLDIGRTDRENASIFRRGIYAAKPLSEGESLAAESLNVVRPEGGGYPRLLVEFIGKRAKTDIAKEAPISAELLY